jgi:hypothetical protein
MDPAGILLQTPIFRDLSVHDVEKLLPDLRERTYARGQTVWIEGDRAGATRTTRDTSLGLRTPARRFGLGRQPEWR